jgi:hypothetical protein
MSHFSTIKTELRDREGIIRAARRLGLTVDEGGDVRGWSGRTIPADVIIRMDDGYDVGLVKNCHGGYDLTADWSMSREANRILGKDGSILTQAYAVDQVCTEAEARGFSVTVTPVADGAVEVELDNFQD